MPEAGDRTERATPRRRDEARKHGQVALSPEVAPVAVLLAALALGSWGAPVALARGRTALAGRTCRLRSLGVVTVDEG